MKISIITATYNSAATLAGCISSVNDQTFQNIEHIIIDGGSTDHTLQIAKNIPNRVTKIISEPDNGIYDAMNKGIRLATGDIIGMLNSDDLYFDNLVLEKIAARFETKNVDCVHADLYYVNKDNVNQIVRYWKTCDYVEGAFKKGWHPAHPTFFVRKEVYEKYGMFNLDFRLGADFELMLRLFERYCITSSYLPEPIVRMRLGGATSKNIQNIIKQNIECFRAFKVNGIKVSSVYPFYRLLPKLKQFLHV
jgi:glycosyltransferase involved in cell wall biosynthesis